MKLIIGLLLCAGVALGQGSSTIFQKLYNNYTGTAPSFTVAVRNTGQEFHQITVNVTDNGGSCSLTSLIIQLQGSFDQTTYFNIGVPISTANAQSPYNTYIFSSVAGAFTYVRGALTSYAQTNCKLNAWYSGSPTGYPTGTAPTPVATDNFKYQTSTSAGATYQGAASCAGSGLVPVIYAAIVADYTPGNATELTLGYATAPAGTGFVAKMTLYLEAGGAGSIVVLPQGPRPYFRPDTGAYVSFGFTPVNASAGLSVTLVYRCEQ